MVRDLSFAAALALWALPAFAAKPNLTPQSSQTHPLPPGTTIAVKPDLIPSISAIFSSAGQISVHNNGAGSAPASVATLSCEKVAGPGGQGLTAPQRCMLLKSQWVSHVVFGTTGEAIKLHVPALAAGDGFTYTLPFWHEIGWSRGRFELTLEADSTGVVNESSETNNVSSVTKTVP